MYIYTIYTYIYIYMPKLVCISNRDLSNLAELCLPNAINGAWGGPEPVLTLEDITRATHQVQEEIKKANLKIWRSQAGADAVADGKPAPPGLRLVGPGPNGPLIDGVSVEVVNKALEAYRGGFRLRVMYQMPRTTLKATECWAHISDMGPTGSPDGVFLVLYESDRGTGRWHAIGARKTAGRAVEIFNDGAVGRVNMTYDGSPKAASKVMRHLTQVLGRDDSSKKMLAVVYELAGIDSAITRITRISACEGGAYLVHWAGHTQPTWMPIPAVPSHLHSEWLRAHPVTPASQDLPAPLSRTGTGTGSV